VVYADSGGVGEMINGCGISIADRWYHGNRNSAPKLKPDDVLSAIKYIRSYIKNGTSLMPNVNSTSLFRKMLDEYYTAIDRALERNRGR
jgi:hypothetical protein